MTDGITIGQASSPALRASDADRDRIIELLRAAQLGQLGLDVDLGRGS